MRADNTPHLRRSAQLRAAHAQRRVHDVLRRLDATGEPISVAAVARSADVSRTYLYSQPALLEAISTLRAARGARPDNVPRRQRATEASLLQRIEALIAKNKQLREDASLLRRQLAVAHADLRDSRRVTSSDRATGC